MGVAGSLRTLGGAPSTEEGARLSFPAPPSSALTLPASTAEAGAGQAPREEAVSLAPGPPGAVGQGWMAGAGRCLVVIRGSQGTEAVSCPLGLAEVRWQQAHSLLRSSRALLSKYDRCAHRLVLRRSGPARGLARR